MSYNEIRQTILFKYHKDINYWYRLLGEMFEGSNGFTKPYKIKCILDRKTCYISWDNYSWDIN